MGEDKNMQDANAQKTCLGSCAALFGIVISTLWMLNLGCGVVEIPDNLPIIGNLDEAFFMIVLLSSLAYFGIEIPFLRNRYALPQNKSKDPGDKNG